MLALKKHSLVIAHRGGKFWEGKNFSYISDSVRDGADIVELDIRIKNGEYIIQHSPFDKNHGRLEDALKLLGTAAIYLDLKNRNIKVNDLVTYVRSRCVSEIIVGTFDAEVLREIRDKSVIKNLHCLWPWSAVEKGRRADAHWINPVCYFVTESLARGIQEAGFKFVPSGNLIFKKKEIVRNQLRYAQYGAYAISTHHVREMKRFLTGSPHSRG